MSVETSRSSRRVVNTQSGSIVHVYGTGRAHWLASTPLVSCHWLHALQLARLMYCTLVLLPSIKYILFKPIVILSLNLKRNDQGPNSFESLTSASRSMEDDGASRAAAAAASAAWGRIPLCLTLALSLMLQTTAPSVARPVRPMLWSCPTPIDASGSWWRCCPCSQP